jgi:hypothetical protein
MTFEKADSRFRFQKIGEVSLKNKANPVTVFEVEG